MVQHNSSDTEATAWPAANGKHNGKMNIFDTHF